MVLSKIVNDPKIVLTGPVSYQGRFVVHVELKSYLYCKYSIFEPCKPNPKKALM
jgi:hypothetical protein